MLIGPLSLPEVSDMENNAITSIISATRISRDPIPIMVVTATIGDIRPVVPNSLIDRPLSILDRLILMNTADIYIRLNYYVPLERQALITFEPFQDGARIKIIYGRLPTNGHSDFAASEIAMYLAIHTKIIEALRH